MADLSGAHPLRHFHRPLRILRHLPEDEDGSEAGPVERRHRRLTEIPQLVLETPTTNGAMAPRRWAGRPTPTVRLAGASSFAFGTASPDSTG